MVKKTPKDEMLLAEMIAAAKSRGLKGCCGSIFKSAGGQTTNKTGAAECCAVGGLAMLFDYDENDDINDLYEAVESRFGVDTGGMISGNDRFGWDEYCTPARDDGESLGWAFRNAME